MKKSVISILFLTAIVLAVLMLICASTTLLDSDSSNTEEISAVGQNVDGNNLNLLQSGIKFTHGVHYEGSNGVWHVYGTPDGTGFIELAGGTNVFPVGFYSGAKLYLSLSEDAGAQIVIRGFSNLYPDGINMFTTQKEGVYVVPDLSKYTGIAVRLQVSQSISDIDAYIVPSISYELPYYGKAMLTLIDDDGDIHFIKDVLPLCEKYGVSISSAVTTTRIGAEERWMDWNDIRICSDNGAEILCHTYSHPTPKDLGELSVQDICERLEMARNTLINCGYSSGEILVYSSSTGYVDCMQEAAKKVFKAGIVIGGNTINTRETDVYSLQRFRIDYATGDGDKSRKDWDSNDIYNFIDLLATCGGYGIMMFHTSNEIWRQLVQVNEDGSVFYDENGEIVLLTDASGNAVIDNDGSRYEQTVGHLVYIPILENIIELAIERGIQIVSASSGIASYYSD